MLVVDDRTAYSRPARGRRPGEAEGPRRQGDPEVGRSEGDRLLGASRGDRLRQPTSCSCPGRSRQTRRSSAGSCGARQEGDRLRLGRGRLRRLHAGGLVRLVLRAGHSRGPGQRCVHQGLRHDVRLELGPPVYVATQAAIAAIRKACADGAATRAEVEKNLHATFIPRIVLGGNLRFTARGDRKGASFSIFKLGAAGKKMLVGST